MTIISEPTGNCYLIGGFGPIENAESDEDDQQIDENQEAMTMG